VAQAQTLSWRSANFLPAMATALQVEIQWATELQDSEFRLFDPFRKLAGDNQLNPYAVISCGDITFSTDVKKAVSGRADFCKLLTFAFPLKANVLDIKVYDKRGMQAAMRGDPLIGEARHEVDLSVFYKKAQPSQVKLVRGQEQKGILRLLIGKSGGAAFDSEEDATEASPSSQGEATPAARENRNRELVGSFDADDSPGNAPVASSAYDFSAAVFSSGVPAGQKITAPERLSAADFSSEKAPVASSAYDMPTAALNSGLLDKDGKLESHKGVTSSAASASAYHKAPVGTRAADDSPGKAPVASGAYDFPAAALNSGLVGKQGPLGSQNQSYSSAISSAVSTSADNKATTGTPAADYALGQAPIASGAYGLPAAAVNSGFADKQGTLGSQNQTYSSATSSAASASAYDKYLSGQATVASGAYDLPTAALNSGFADKQGTLGSQNQTYSSATSSASAYQKAPVGTPAADYSSGQVPVASGAYGLRLPTAAFNPGFAGKEQTYNVVTSPTASPSAYHKATVGTPASDDSPGKAPVASSAYGLPTAALDSGLVAPVASGAYGLPAAALNSGPADQEVTLGSQNQRYNVVTSSAASPSAYRKATVGTPTSDYSSGQAPVASSAYGLPASALDSGLVGKEGSHVAASSSEGEVASTASGAERYHQREGPASPTHSKGSAGYPPVSFSAPAVEKTGEGAPSMPVAKNSPEDVFTSVSAPTGVPTMAAANISAQDALAGVSAASGVPMIAAARISPQGAFSGVSAASGVPTMPAAKISPQDAFAGASAPSGVPTLPAAKISPKDAFAGVSEPTGVPTMPAAKISPSDAFAGVSAPTLPAAKISQQDKFAG